MKIFFWSTFHNYIKLGLVIIFYRLIKIEKCVTQLLYQIHFLFSKSVLGLVKPTVLDMFIWKATLCRLQSDYRMAKQTKPIAPK